MAISRKQSRVPKGTGTSNGFARELSSGSISTLNPMLLRARGSSGQVLPRQISRISRQSGRMAHERRRMRHWAGRFD
jgi:hypothetical protein